MSVHVSSVVWQSHHLTGTPLLIMLSLADQSNDEGECFPSHKSLARRCRCDESTIKRGMRTLIRDGYVSAEVRVDAKNGRQKSNIYAINLTKMTSDDRGGVDAPLGQADTPRGLQPDTPPGFQVSPPIEPSIEPSFESSGSVASNGGTHPFELLQALADVTGADLNAMNGSVKAKQCAVGVRLMKSGFTPDDVRRITEWLRSQSWRTGGIDLFTIEKERGGWELNGKPSTQLRQSESDRRRGVPA